MDMPKNQFKQRLRQGQVGLFVGLASGYTMETLAGGFRLAVRAVSRLRARRRV